MKSNKHHAFTGVHMPVEIWFDKTLSPTDKILMTEIVNLTKASKTCFKSNQGFSDLLGVGKDRVTRLLASLKERGYIDIDMEYKPNSKQIIRRTISLTKSFRRVLLGGLDEDNNNDTPIVENNDTLSVKTPIGIVENNDTPIVENNEDNKSINNKSINNPPIPPKGDDSELSFELFWDKYDKKADKVKCERKWKALSVEDKKAILAYLPGYVTSTPDKQYRKNPQTFLNNRSWEDELLTGTVARAIDPKKLSNQELRMALRNGIITKNDYDTTIEKRAAGY